MKTLKEIKTAIIKEGGKEFKNLTVKNINVDFKDNYVRLGLTLDKEVPAMLANEDGAYELGSSKVIFTSTFTVAALLQENARTAFIGTKLRKTDDPEMVQNVAEIFLSHANIDVIQETVAAETDYINPYSSKEEPVQYDHETIITHVTRIELSDVAKEYIKDIVRDSFRRH